MVQTIESFHWLLERREKLSIFFTAKFLNAGFANLASLSNVQRFLQHKIAKFIEWLSCNRYKIGCCVLFVALNYYLMSVWRFVAFLLRFCLLCDGFVGWRDRRRLNSFELKKIPASKLFPEPPKGKILAKRFGSNPPPSSDLSKICKFSQNHKIISLPERKLHKTDEFQINIIFKGTMRT